MESIISFLTNHSTHAHWYIFIALLLAGCNLPISIDVLVIFSAVLATQIVPENTLSLYLCLLFGSALSAWISYLIGRTAGYKLSKWKLFRPIFSEKRIAHLDAFYKKHGSWAFLIGRFIPFGIRNCIFMSSGLTRMPFLKFILREFIACFVWVTTTFVIFYEIGDNFETIWTAVKKANLFIFIFFALAGIGVFWYKKFYKKSTDNQPPYL